MNNSVSILAAGHATSALLSISFTVCVVFDLIFPEHAMYKSWQAFLPGFQWLSWNSYLIGLFETYAYGWFFVLIWVPIYNLVNNKQRHRHD